jgi:hypothetical protein
MEVGAMVTDTFPVLEHLAITNSIRSPEELAVVSQLFPSVSQLVLMHS